MTLTSFRQILHMEKKLKSEQVCNIHRTFLILTYFYAKQHSMELIPPREQKMESLKKLIKQVLQTS